MQPRSTSTQTRRDFLKLAAAAAVSIPASRLLAQSATTQPKTQPPNLVLLLTDDQRADSLGCAGNPVLRTPNIDNLANRGVRFRNAFATTAICVCSRASILTGLWTRSHGIDTFEKPLPQPLFQQTYPMLLKKAGYRVGFVGKWGLGGPLPVDSYNYFKGYSGQGFYFEPGRKEHLTVLQANQATEFIAGCSPQVPFCVAVSFKAPHVQDEGRVLPGIYAKYPYDMALDSLYQKDWIAPPTTVDAAPQPEFLNRTLNRLREAPDFSPETYQQTMKCLYRLLTGVDDAVGKIVDALQHQGVADNTVIVFTSDHGSFYGQHGFGGKWLMHEESIRSPLVVYDPRLPKNERGTVRDETVLNVDIMPTLLDFAGVSPPVGVQGQSWRPLVYGKQTPPRSEWFYEHPFGDLANIPIARSEGIRQSQLKYMRYIDTKPVCEQLYDVQSDPREERNLATLPEHQADLQKLRARWTDWRQSLQTSRRDAAWTAPA